MDNSKYYIQSSFLKTIVFYCNLHNFEYLGLFEEQKLNLNELRPYSYLSIEKFEYILSELCKKNKTNPYTVGESFNLSNLGPIGFYLLNHASNYIGLKKFLEVSDMLTNCFLFEFHQNNQLSFSILNKSKMSLSNTLAFLGGAFYSSLNQSTLGLLDLEKIYGPEKLNIIEKNYQAIYTQERIEFFINLKSIETPNFFYDEEINGFLEKHINLKMLKDVTDDKKFLFEVEERAHYLVRIQSLESDRMANDLNISLRSLQAKLNKSGQSFREIKSQSLKEYALELIDSGVTDADKVCEFLNFKNTSGLNQAFKRWFDMSYKDYISGMK